MSSATEQKDLSPEADYVTVGAVDASADEKKSEPVPSEDEANLLALTNWLTQNVEILPSLTKIYCRGKFRWDRFNLSRFVWC